MLTGGCACGNIRYECSGEPIVQLMCHCRDCQRSSGTAFSAMMMFASDRFRYLKGEPVFLCCEGCRKKALADSDGTLSRVKTLRAKAVGSEEK